ncbi:XRE family transcriptional regulator [Corallincola luteus]|uniref:XRE family transcriptional regulator n=4 Tax=Psychromonadaceae TaxID=267894 RepID=A0A368NKE8_9GAMM|nr:XRE family transcriptional regulator [Corallincola holothuriorum]TAA48774.1 XRE family transcriptional regulator [Corallincola spongiicola]TCI05669.1 XRE family transcriptional regulator [Corallincola luteus]
MGEQSVSAFARRVELSESLVRKYLSGSEPSLSKANQIAMKANCSLEWLATGCGYEYRKAEVVDMEALEKSVQLTMTMAEQNDLSVANEKVMKVIVATYQYLRATKKKDGYFDLDEATPFVRYVMGLCD